MQRLHCIFLFLFLASSGLGAQGLALPLGNPSYELLDRLSLRFGYAEVPRPAFHPGLRPVERGPLLRLLRSYELTHGDQLSAIDRFWLQYTYDDNNEWLALPPLTAEHKDEAANWLTDSLAIRATRQEHYRRSQRSLLNIFYHSPANFLEVNEANFYLRLNPILDLRFGKMRNDAQDYYYNRRGVEMRGGVDERIFFYFQILETQNSLPNYLADFRRRFEALPGAGFVKNFNGQGITNGVDFLNSQGYVSFDATPHVGLTLGYGNHFIGSGERSLLLSDFSNNYPFLQLNWRVWKFHYQNLYAQLSDGPLRTGTPGQPSPQKYFAAHHLSINLGKRLNLGLFEAVVLNRHNGFELAYLNPVIFTAPWREASAAQTT
ncbi:MAG: hypothetical protein HC821_00745 [Lewinella sp.]|nr:hypothetical protein [Lewinella sp.]